MLANFSVTTCARQVLAKIKTSLLISAGAFFVASIFPVSFVYAAKCGGGSGVDIGGLVGLGGGVRIGDAFGNFGEFATALVMVGLFAAALIFLVMLIWGGYRYLSAGGDADNTKAARSTLTNAGVGLVIVVASLGVYQVFNQMFGLDQSSSTRTGPPGTMRISCDQLDELAKKMPVQTADYHITYDSEIEVFFVVVQEVPVKENALKAVKWFKLQGVEDHCDLAINYSYSKTLEIDKGKRKPSDFPLCQ